MVALKQSIRKVMDKLKGKKKDDASTTFKYTIRDGKYFYAATGEQIHHPAVIEQIKQHEAGLAKAKRKRDLTLKSFFPGKKASKGKTERVTGRDDIPRRPATAEGSATIQAPTPTQYKPYRVPAPSGSGQVTSSGQAAVSGQGSSSAGVLYKPSEGLSYSERMQRQNQMIGDVVDAFQNASHYNFLQNVSEEQKPNEDDEVSDLDPEDERAEEDYEVSEPDESESGQYMRDSR